MNRIENKLYTFDDKSSDEVLLINGFEHVNQLIFYFNKLQQENKELKQKDYDHFEYLKRIDNLEKENKKLKAKNQELNDLTIRSYSRICSKCDAMISDSPYMSDIAIRQYAKEIINIAKYYIPNAEMQEIIKE